ncbi:MAG: hypothetical protein JHC12_03120 [Thermogladius sp.]|nr:hypothetical protein [Thermogladius sp.]
MSVVKRMDGIIRELGGFNPSSRALLSTLYLSLLSPVYIILLSFSALLNLPDEVVSSSLVIGFIGQAATSALMLYLLSTVNQLADNIAEYTSLVADLIMEKTGLRVDPLEAASREFKRGFRTYMEWYPLAILVGLVSLLSYRTLIYAVILFELYSALNAFFLAQAKVSIEGIVDYINLVEEEISAVIETRKTSLSTRIDLEDKAIAFGSLLFNSITPIACYKLLLTLGSIVDKFRGFHVEVKYVLTMKEFVKPGG